MLRQGISGYLLGDHLRLRSIEQFAERHGLILIIALGESLLSIGVGIEGLPLIGGIVLTALGLKKVLEYAGDTEHDLTYPLTGPALAALLGGVVLYLLAQVGFKLSSPPS